MVLHEAVQAARKELNLSQKKLAELAGIQRRQLATLEAGGNVTLATLRKVLAHLPNLESFSIDAVTATVRRNVNPSEQEEVVAKALEVMTAALKGLAAAVKAGRKPGEREIQVFERASEVMYAGLGYTPEVAQGPAAGFVEAVERPAFEAELAELEAKIEGAADEQPGK